MKRVSIVMPVYNGKQYISESIESILNQTYDNWELIVVNEFGSDDGSKEIIESYAKKDKRIKIIQNSQREGISESLNIGLRSATGEFIARMDSDDISGARRIEKQVEYLENNPSIGLCGIQPEFFGTEKLYWELECDPIRIRNNIFFYTPCVHPTVMFRREIIDKYKIFYNKDYKATEDYDFFSKVVGVTDIANINDNTLFKYRMYANNATNRNNNIGIKLYSEVMKRCFKEYLDLDFTDEEVDLLSCHISTGDSSKKELYDKVVKLDILLKKILLKTKKNKKYKTEEMFKTLRKRWQELRWSIPEKYRSNVTDFIIDKSIFNREYFYEPKKIDLSNADITVLMPVYNSEKYILDSTLSILEQTYENFIIYVMIESDNGDATEEYLSLLDDNRIKIIKNKTKLGLAKTLNEGIKLAKTKYIARMDSDDMSLKERFEKQRDLLENDEEIALVSTWQRHFGDFGSYIHNSESSPEDLAASLLFRCDICHSTVMFRRELMIEKNYFYNENMAMEDFDLWNRMLIDEKLYCIPEVLGEYRIHSENITHTKHQKVIDSEISIISRSLERLKIMPGTYDKRLLIGWDYVYNDNKKLVRKAVKLLKRIKDQNIKLTIYNQKSLEKSLNKRLNWIKGKEDYIEKDSYVSPNKKSRIKTRIKRIARPFIMPFYSRLMNRIDNKVNEKIDSNNSQIENKILESINKIDNECNLLKQENKELFSKIKQISEDCYVRKYKPYTGGKVRICFIFQVPSFWPSFESVYKELIHDDRFEFKFYHLDLPHKEPSQMKSANGFLKKNKINYELLTISKLESFDPHIVIFQTPYDEWHRTEEFSSEKIRDMGIRLAYIPYGIEFGGDEESLDLQYNSKFLNNMWRLYTMSEVTQKYFCIYSKLTLENVKALGHPKFDSLFNKCMTTNYDFKKLAKNKKIVIVKMHFLRKFKGRVVTPDINIYMEFLDNISKYSKEYFFIFMAHPLMFDEEKHGEYKVLIDKIKDNSKYCYLYTDEDYREPLYCADAFICDRSSISIEMAAFNKPILFLENSENKEVYVKEFSDLFDSYIKGTDYKSIDNFIKDLSKGKLVDSYKKYTEAFKIIVPAYDGNSSKRIVDNIYEEITKEDIEKE